jgi:hypothetical protein
METPPLTTQKRSSVTYIRPRRRRVHLNMVAMLSGEKKALNCRDGGGGMRGRGGMLGVCGRRGLL